MFESIDALVGEAAPEPQKAPDALGREDFLRMLIAQLENQDPLNPQDASEFSAQLAQFSSLEQLLNISQSFETMAESQSVLTSSIESLATTGLIGRDIVASGGLFEIAEDGSFLSRPGFDIEASATAVDLSVSNADGALLRTFGLGERAQGFHQIPLSALEGLAPGAYQFEVTGQVGSETVTAQPFFTGRVTGAIPAEDGALVQIGGLLVPYADVSEIREGGDS